MLGQLPCSLQRGEGHHHPDLTWAVPADFVRVAAAAVDRADEAADQGTVLVSDANLEYRERKPAVITDGSSALTVDNLPELAGRIDQTDKGPSPESPEPVPIGSCLQYRLPVHITVLL